MQIEKLEIKGFGKLEDNSLLLGRGINIIYGFNESGKTTLQWFIKSMLYGVKGGRSSKEGIPPPSKRFRPWNGARFGGSMEYRLDNGMLIRVERNFENNLVAVFDENFKNITNSFDFSKETGPLFAEKHLGINETYFEKIVLVRQMETRLDDEGRSGLLGKFANISQTGFEDISLKDTQNNLKAALKNYVGTDRTRTSPVDKLSARLEALKVQRMNLVESKRRLLDTEAALRGAVAKKAELCNTHEYMENARELVELKKRLLREKEKEASLQEIYGAVYNAEKAISDATAQYESLKKKAAGYAGGKPPEVQSCQESSCHSCHGDGSRGRKSCQEGQTCHENRPRGSEICHAGPLKVAAFIMFFCSIVSAISGQLFKPALFLLAGILLAIGVVLLYFSLRKLKVAEKIDPVLGLETAKALEVKLQEIIRLKDVLKVLCEKASAVSGRPAGSSTEAGELLAALSAEVGSMELKLEAGISACINRFMKQEIEFFDIKRLQLVASALNLNLLESSWQNQYEILEKKLDELSLKIREYETVLKSDDAESNDLQAIDEEIAELERQKEKLEDTGTSIKIALEVLEEAASELHRDYAPNLNEKMSHFIYKISGGKYNSLKADDKLALLTISPETGNVTTVPVLSNGTIDQMYLALRLAAAELAFCGESLPIILDEAFAQYDDIRTLETLKLISEYYCEGQVLIFTSKSREVELAEAACNGNINLIRI